MTATDTPTPGTWYTHTAGVQFHNPGQGSHYDYIANSGGTCLHPESAAALVDVMRFAEAVRAMIGDDVADLIARGELPDGLWIAPVVNKGAPMPDGWEANPDDGWDPDKRYAVGNPRTVRLIVAPEPRTKRVPLAFLAGETLPGGEVVRYPFAVGDEWWWAKVTDRNPVPLTVADDGTVEVLDTADPS